ncbi:hypothetical protein QEN19_001087 [Hanseniaspora menglaensis]
MSFHKTPQQTSRSHIKLPPLESILQMQGANSFYNTPTSNSIFAPYALPYISPTISDGGSQNASFPGKSNSSYDEKVNLHMNKLKFSGSAVIRPLSPPDSSNENFQHSYNAKLGDYLFCSDQRSKGFASSPKIMKKSFDFSLSPISVFNKQLLPSYTWNNQEQVLKTISNCEKNKITKLKKPMKKLKDNTSGQFAFILHSTNSYSNNKDPIIDNEQLARQKRRRTDGKVVLILENFYNSKSKKPNKAEKVKISDKTGLTVSQVQVWFQNRRSRDSRNEKNILKT